MWVALAKTLSPWETLEDSPSLKTIGAALKALPDWNLLAALRRYRGRGRDEYPVHVLWGVVVLTVLLRHTSTEATLGKWCARLSGSATSCTFWWTRRPRSPWRIA